MMKIGKFKKEDSIQVSNMIIKCLNEVNSNDYPKTVINFMTKKFSPEEIEKLSQRRSIYVASENRRIVGTVSVDKNAVFSLFVDTTKSRNGIGTRLMKKAESIVKRNYRTIKVPSSITAYEFYRKLGYTKSREKYDKGYGKVIIMYKRL